MKSYLPLMSVNFGPWQCNYEANSCFYLDHSVCIFKCKAQSSQSTKWSVKSSKFKLLWLLLLFYCFPHLHMYWHGNNYINTHKFYSHIPAQCSPQQWWPGEIAPSEHPACLRPGRAQPVAVPLRWQSSGSLPPRRSCPHHGSLSEVDRKFRGWRDNMVGGTGVRGGKWGDREWCQTDNKWQKNCGDGNMEMSK